MCGLFTRRLRPLLQRAGTTVQQKATYIHSKPAQNNVGVLESVFVMTVMTLTIMVPSCWVLSNLDYYKTRK